MSQSQKMKKALEENVIPKLTADGFVGKYPDYRRICEDHIELISFPQYKYGNAFCVLASVAYPNAEKAKQNVNHHFFNGELSDLTADDCGDLRYYMKGNFGDRFYYTDVYLTYLCGLTVEGVSEEKAKTYKRKWYELRVQKADESVYQKVCDKVNRQLPKVYKWWAKMNKKNLV